jgi:hypothetical protein
MNGLGLKAGRLGHALRSAAGWRAQPKADTLRREDTQDRLDDGDLSDAWPAQPWKIMSVARRDWAIVGYLI